ncbi:NAD(P)-dependent alcohol dehydrogenase [Nocardia seriolae]|uniref:alcohol dehydrogenase n=1 Tax=Nocardia seriolae TaxID=37332 RepID=A0A0B8NB33_9NOCA|nr:NAD(P)-dependent alcohol dehydrogenase [Nocardia seriolae]MTJ66089.1 alcohol dehydrogenase catalytic domain-containing protein [Nocardia seriolae]MTJ74119.1 alcohol dehydrogenase catalytic domain-containing protein [Nocardia seriolae]MTJ85994.1 alcohol dehydrogenase catalytic domain-containing protein [Nocardia seriolae]MTK29988.1 alcohol dehydrogenase catalytic domain-containing protein [Nocardia seriolae]MTK44084.1 alcohol dehydrogenase catalytic domain-containing protein [Nocardia seriol
MRALQWTGPEKVQINDIPVPEIGPTDLLLKVGAAGVCHSDLTLVNFPYQLREDPLTLGHEIAGTIEAIGSDVAGREIGERGLVYLFWTCGVCRECVSGNENVCLAAGRVAMPPCPGLSIEGGMAEYVRIPATSFVPIGDLDFVQAAPVADAALTAYHAIRGAKENLRPGGTVVAIGIGGLGHVAVQILHAISGVRVIAVDQAQEKLDLAADCGAELGFLSGDDTAGQILDLTGGRGADAVFDFVGVDATARLACETVAPNGAYRMVGIGDGAPEITAGPAGGPGLPWGATVRKSLGGTRGDLYDCVALAQAGKIHMEVERFDLVDGPEALRRLDAGQIRGRAVLVP